jgi:hypothetical protein
LDDSGHVLLVSIKCAADNPPSTQQVFQLIERWHFKIDASKHFNLKCGSVFRRKSLVVFSESRIGTINAVVFGSRQSISPEFGGDHERIIVEIISRLGG